jgi:5-methylcytosine-specific restriction endonuclease McrA
MNTYSDSKDNRYTTPQIEANIKKSALLKLEIQFLEYEYNFCEQCKQNDCKPIDVSHTVSRKTAKENGTVELLWDLDNLEILGRRCHKLKDKLNLF